MENEQKSQLQTANEALMALKINVTTADRTEAKKQWSEPTIIRYLRGEGADADTAVALLKFFRKRIEGRATVISKEVQN